MIADIYSNSPSAQRRHGSGPFLEERIRFLSHLKAQGYVRTSLVLRAPMLLIIAEDTDLLSREGVSRAEVAKQISKAMKNKKRRFDDEKGRYKNLLRLGVLWLVFLKKLAPRQNARTEAIRSHFPVVSRYLEYLKNERGAAPVTVLRREWNAVDFLYLFCRYTSKAPMRRLLG